MVETRNSKSANHAPFVVAVILLIGAGVLVGPGSGWANLRQAKRALPIRKPLSALNESALRPYKVAYRNILEPTVIEALGTTEYLDWTLENPNASSTDPFRRANLFITYDSGGTNLVPHTPDECRLGAGYQAAQAHENRNLMMEVGSRGRMEVPVRLCSFIKTAVFNRQESSVVYTFGCNGKMVATRPGVRLLINDPRNTYAYFSKVEISFPYASREETVAGAAKLLERLLPELWDEHWPEFEAAEAKSEVE